MGDGGITVYLRCAAKRHTAERKAAWRTFKIALCYAQTNGTTLFKLTCTDEQAAIQSAVASQHGTHHELGGLLSQHFLNRHLSLCMGSTPQSGEKFTKPVLGRSRDPASLNEPQIEMLDFNSERNY